MSRARSRQRGAAMLVVMIIVSALMTAAGSAIYVSTGETQATVYAASTPPALYCAEAGLAGAPGRSPATTGSWGDVLDGTPATIRRGTRCDGDLRRDPTATAPRLRGHDPRQRRRARADRERSATKDIDMQGLRRVACLRYPESPRSVTELIDYSAGVRSTATRAARAPPTPATPTRALSPVVRSGGGRCSGRAASVARRAARGARVECGRGVPQREQRRVEQVAERGAGVVDRVHRAVGIDRGLLPRGAARPERGRGSRSRRRRGRRAPRGRRRRDAHPRAARGDRRARRRCRRRRRGARRPRRASAGSAGASAVVTRERRRGIGLLDLEPVDAELAREPRQRRQLRDVRAPDDGRDPDRADRRRAARARQSPPRGSRPR